ncbi:Cytochrome c oxidase subunit 7A, partial [Colletotrichum shisoi]
MDDAEIWDCKPLTRDDDGGELWKLQRRLRWTDSQLPLLATRRNLVLDLGIALGLGFAMANVYWYGFHMPRTNARDSYYAKLEQQKAEA